MQCMICHEEMASSSIRPICQTRPDHALCAICYKDWTTRLHLVACSQCPLCRGPLLPISPSLFQKICSLIDRVDKDLHQKLERLIQDRIARWILFGMYFFTMYQLISLPIQLFFSLVKEILLF